MHGEDDDPDGEPSHRPLPPDSGSGSHRTVGRRTQPRGLTVLQDPPGSTCPIVNPDENALADAITARVRMEVQRTHSAFRKALVAVAVAALGALGTVGVWALNSREAAGDERARMRYLERGFERLVNDVYRLRLRADEPDRPDAVTRPSPRSRPDANTGATP